MDSLIAKVGIIAEKLNSKLYVQPSEDDGVNIFHHRYGFVCTLYPEDAGNEQLYIREALTYLSEVFNEKTDAI